MHKQSALHSANGHSIVLSDPLEQRVVHTLNSAMDSSAHALRVAIREQMVQVGPLMSLHQLASFAGEPSAGV